MHIESEVSKNGIKPPMFPLSNYLMDLNSGQSYYRLTYPMVAVLKHARAASPFLAAIQPLYNHFFAMSLRAILRERAVPSGNALNNSKRPFCEMS